MYVSLSLSLLNTWTPGASLWTVCVDRAASHQSESGEPPRRSNQPSGHHRRPRESGNSHEGSGGRRDDVTKALGTLDGGAFRDSLFGTCIGGWFQKNCHCKLCSCCDSAVCHVVSSKTVYLEPPPCGTTPYESSGLFENKDSGA